MQLKAVVFDWAGTMVDFGSRAPVEAFRKLFDDFGIEISEAEARAPMGLNKKDHIREILAMDRPRELWESRHGPAGEPAVDRLFARFRELDGEVVARFTDLIPGAAETVRELRRRGLKIGSTTGYNRDVMDAVLLAAAAQGYRPDNVVCADDVPAGRPTPMMMYRCFLDLEVWPAHSVVKVDDTTPGLLEGKEAGCWTVGVALSGNAAALDLADLDRRDSEAVQQARERAVAELKSAHPDFIIDTVADLPPIIDRIETRSG